MLTGLMIAGCSTTTKDEVSADMDKVRGVHSREDMIARTRMILEESPNLTDTQKDKFIELRGQTLDVVMDQTARIRKLKVVLFESMTAENYNPAKVREVTRQLKKAYNKRLDTMFNSMKKAQTILGKDAPKALYKMEDHSLM